MAVDVLDLLLDEDDAAPAPAAEVAPVGAPQAAPGVDTETLDLLMSEFREAESPEAQRDALMALLSLTRK